MAYILFLLIIIVFASLLVLLTYLAKKHVSFTKRVSIALGGGIIFGLALQYIFGLDSPVLNNALPWINLVGKGYVSLLRMITYPLIIVSLISSVLKSHNLGKVSLIVIAVLVLTAGIAGTVGYATAAAFKLDASEISQGESEKKRAEYIETKADSQKNLTIPDRILEVIPSNPFLDMTGQRSTSAIAVVIFSMLIGWSALGIKKKKEAEFELFSKIIDMAYAVVMRLVQMILKLTPLGVFAMMTNTLASTKGSSILDLVKFAGASYVAIIIMFLIHLIILFAFGYNPIQYLKKSVTALTFAFTSRSSMATLPITIDTLSKKMGVSEGVANISATFGTSIGQNGCAAIYPAMLAVMIAPTVGIDIFSLSFFIPLILIIVISSFGVAGVGGGATFAAIMVLSAMNLPIGLAGLLISVEAIIDMARTALNVSDSMVSGLVTAKVTDSINKEIYDNNNLELALD